MPEYKHEGGSIGFGDELDVEEQKGGTSLECFPVL